MEQGVKSIEPIAQSEEIAVLKKTRRPVVKQPFWSRQGLFLKAQSEEQEHGVGSHNGGSSGKQKCVKVSAPCPLFYALCPSPFALPPTPLVRQQAGTYGMAPATFARYISTSRCH